MMLIRAQVSCECTEKEMKCGNELMKCIWTIQCELGKVEVI